MSPATEVVPVSSPRIASMTWVTGLMATQPCSQSGSVLAGTKVDEPNVSGKTMRNDRPCTAPELRASMPISTDTQHRLTANATIRSTARPTCHHGVVNSKPMIAPKTRVTVIAMECRTMSPSTAPNRGADRAIGSERKRSKTPFWMSVLRLTPMVSEVNMIVCTMMPGSANSTYLPVDPAMAPPKMKTNSTVMMMGCTVTSTNCSGLRNIFVTVRLARIRESRIMPPPPRWSSGR